MEEDILYQLTMQDVLAHLQAPRNGISGLSVWSTSGMLWRVCRPWEIIRQLPGMNEKAFRNAIIEIQRKRGSTVNG